MSWQLIQNEYYNEDCLYLNVIAPANASTDPQGYPVLVYFHGGGFMMGDVIRSGFDKATTNFAKRGIITVTVPYRLGLYGNRHPDSGIICKLKHFLGFMSLGTKEAPGNIGMWDQIAAIKFIKANAKYFGGNPQNIIIWGESAGSAAVDLLSLSPHSRGLCVCISLTSESLPFRSLPKSHPRQWMRQQ